MADSIQTPERVDTVRRTADRKETNNRQTYSRQMIHIISDTDRDKYRESQIETYRPKKKRPGFALEGRRRQSLYCILILNNLIFIKYVLYFNFSTNILTVIIFIMILLLTT